jgi:hypothetical protein
MNPKGGNRVNIRFRNSGVVLDSLDHVHGPELEQASKQSNPSLLTLPILIFQHDGSLYHRLFLVISHRELPFPANAIHSISTGTPSGSALTATQLLAGLCAK